MEVVELDARFGQLFNCTQPFLLDSHQLHHFRAPEISATSMTAITTTSSSSSFSSSRSKAEMLKIRQRTYGVIHFATVWLLG